MLSLLDRLYFALRGTTSCHGAIHDPILEDVGDDFDEPIIIDEVR